ncbi:MAG: LysM peptidoglycan-binding domain-containing protein, partial [Flavobacteriales bacterium]
MHKLYTLLLATCLSGITLAKASNVVDSIGVENNKGKKVIIHQVDPKDTYYSIARKYNVSHKDVMAFNDAKQLQIGVTLKVPTEIPFSNTTVLSTVTNNSGLTEYAIKPKDNLNMLAERFGTTVNELKRVNNLTSINLQVGQILKIPNANATEVVAVPTKTVIATTPQTTTPVQTVNTASLNSIEHTVAAKENLNLLAQRYGTTIDEIKKLNGLTSSNLRIGQVLKIASANALTTETRETIVKAPVVVVEKPVVKEPSKPAVNTTKPTTEGFEHVVVAGETIYSIAKKYNLTTYQIKTANSLTANEVKVGQKLIINTPRSVAVASINNEEDEDDSVGTNSNTLKDPSLRLPASRYGLTQFEEKGTAVWIADQDLDPAKMYVLHRTAPVGTVIKVTNPMSNRSAFAKVVGKFTENETTKDVIIVMTKAVADAVGALDKRFFCNINY